MATAPEIIPTLQTSSSNPYSGYYAKYIKVNMDDAEERQRLEAIETRALDPKDSVIVLSYDKFSFQDQFFIIAKYLEKR